MSVGGSVEVPVVCDVARSESFIDSDSNGSDGSDGECGASRDVS